MSHDSQRSVPYSRLPCEAIATSNLSDGYHRGWVERQPPLSNRLLGKHSLPLKALVTSNPLNISSAAVISDEKIGVLLLNLGGPETLDDVQPFLFNLFADPVYLLTFKCRYYLYFVSVFLRYSLTGHGKF